MWVQLRLDHQIPSQRRWSGSTVALYMYVQYHLGSYSLATVSATAYIRRSYQASHCLLSSGALPEPLTAVMLTPPLPTDNLNASSSLCR
jgi:hypothetical protein